MSRSLKRLQHIVLIQAESMLCIDVPFQETEDNFVPEESHSDLSVLLSSWRCNGLQVVLPGRRARSEVRSWCREGFGTDCVEKLQLGVDLLVG